MFGCTIVKTFRKIFKKLTYKLKRVYDLLENAPTDYLLLQFLKKYSTSIRINRKQLPLYSAFDKIALKVSNIFDAPYSKEMFIDYFVPTL